MPLSHVPISFIASKSVASAALTWSGLGFALNLPLPLPLPLPPTRPWTAHQSLVGGRQSAARADGVAAAVCARRHRGARHGVAHRDVRDERVRKAHDVEAAHVLGEPEGQLPAHLG